MFDLISWTWDYEALDLDGWIPDFVITNARRLLLVEVKPYDNLDQATVSKIERAIRYSRNTDEEEDLIGLPEVLIVAPGILPNKEYPYCLIGWTLQFCFGRWDTAWGPWNAAALMEPCGKRVPYGLTGDSTGSYENLIAGCGGECCVWDGDHNYRPAHRTQIEPLWREAGNRVQWKAPRSARR